MSPSTFSTWNANLVKSERDILSDLTPPQREAVTHIEGPLLILAGAGSGKTRVITRRVAYLLEKGVRPGGILAITFTNKAADEMKERVARLTVAKGLRISTFHSFCARELRRFADRVGLTPSYTIYDTNDKLRLIRECMNECDVDSSTIKPASVEASISSAKNIMLPAGEFAAQEKSFYGERVGRVFVRYEQRMRALNAVDFDDLLLKMVELLEKQEDVRAALQEEFRFVMVDEYQDTNAAQYRIVRGLTKKHTNLAVTGDPDQAIYGWRGADIRNILHFERDYPGARTVRLERNYRSTKTILAAAEGLIVHNRKRKKKELFTENPAGNPVRLIEAENEMDEARRVASEIRGLLDRKTSPREIAVFYRVNALSRVLETALREADVPYRIIAGVSFYERKEIRDLLAYLRLMINPADDISCERIINVPPRNLGKTSVDRLRQFARESRISLLGACSHPGELSELSEKSRGSVGAFAGLVAELTKYAGARPTEALKTVLAKTGYTSIFGKSEEESQRLANVKELVAGAAQYEETHPEDASVLGFLENVALVSDQDDYDEDRNAVSLMTLHAAKGLEFPFVFIVALEEGILPHERSANSDEEIEEERRLLYVGMTRAMRELTLSLAFTRRRYDRTDICVPSSFLAEIPRDTMKKLQYAQAEPARTFSPRRTTSAPEPETTTALLKRGDRVRHAEYGLGIVDSISGSGAKLKAVIRFEQVGFKTLMVKFAKLEKLVVS